MNNQVTKTTRKPAEFFVISNGYWSGQGWEIEVGGIKSRKDAEAEVQKLQDRDFDSHWSAQHGYDVRHGRKFRIVTKSEIRRMFGESWYENFRPERLK